MRVLSTGTGPVRRDGRPRPRRVHHVGRLTGELLISGGAHQEKVTAAVVLLDQGERVRLANETSEPVSLLACLPPRLHPCAPQLAPRPGGHLEHPVGRADCGPASSGRPSRLGDVAGGLPRELDALSRSWLLATGAVSAVRDPAASRSASTGRADRER